MHPKEDMTMKTESRIGRWGRKLTLGAAVALAACLPVAAQAQYPNKPIHLVVPYAAGTTTDLLARQLSEKAGAILGQPIVVENKAGASGVIGSQYVAKAAPDGYTIEFAANQTHATNAVLIRNLAYDPFKDFTPIARLAMQSQVLVVHPSLKVKTVGELVALAKSKPGKLNFPSTGNGTGAHLAGEYFKTIANVDVVHVPYNNAQVFVDLLAGNTQFMFYPYAPLKGYIEGGQLVPIATSGVKRAPWLPNLPTLVESGFQDFVFASWFALFGPAGMPADIVDKIAGAYRQVLESPEVRAALATNGTEAWFGSPAELTASMSADIERVRKIVASGSVKVE